MRAFITTIMFLFFGVVNTAAQTYETIGILQPSTGKKSSKVKKIKGNAEFVDYTALDFEIKAESADLPNSARGFLLTVTINNEELVFDDNNQVIESALNIFFKVLKQDRKSVGIFEEGLLIQINQTDNDQALKNASKYRKYFELPPGSYKIDLVLRDKKSGNWGIRSAKFEIPN